MTTNYKRGRAVERRFVLWLRARKWIATRTPASKGSFDVIAVKYFEVRDCTLALAVLAQCKRSGRVSKEELDALTSDARKGGAIAMLVVPKRGGFVIQGIHRDLTRWNVDEDWFGEAEVL